VTWRVDLESASDGDVDRVVGDTVKVHISGDIVCPSLHELGKSRIIEDSPKFLNSPKKDDLVGSDTGKFPAGGFSRP
jgi:transcriptional regulator of nitric oxide reductase